MSIIIVGGGVSGLYLGIKLLKLHKNVTILEKDSRVGGRIYTRRFLDYKYESGAGRFSNLDTNLIGLIKNYGLGDNIVSIGSSRKDLYDKLIKSLISNRIDLYSITTIDYLKIVLGDREADRFLALYGYDGDILVSSAMCGINMLLTDYNTKEYYVLLGGLETLIRKMKAEYLSLGGKLLLNFHIDEIYKGDSYYRIYTKDTSIDCDKLILSIPPKDLAKLYPRNKAFSFIKYICPIPLLRIYFLYKTPQSALVNIRKTISELDIRFIIPINSNIIMISYTDYTKATSWNDLYKSDKDMFYKKLLREFYLTTGVKLDKPDKVSLEYWDSGIHLWTPGFNYIKNYSKIIQPLNNLFLSNEAYSKNQGWIEGSLTMANDVLLSVI